MLISQQSTNLHNLHLYPLVVQPRLPPLLLLRLLGAEPVLGVS
jgi:hypothetical protein